MPIQLSELIAQLRVELAEAIQAGEDSDLRFELGPIELELTVGVAKEVSPGAKVKFWVVELGSEATVGSTATQRISLTLDARRASQPDRRPLISGEELNRER